MKMIFMVRELDMDKNKINIGLQNHEHRKLVILKSLLFSKIEMDLLSRLIN